MPQSLSQIFVRLVYSTKDRHPFLRSAELRGELHSYLAGACRGMNCPPMIVGGVEDHVHLLFGLARDRSISDLVRDLKTGSSKWIKTKGTEFARFQWQAGYGAFSVSPSHAKAVRVYIANQEEHHKKESFQDEFRRLLKKYGIEYDERYVWD